MGLLDFFRRKPPIRDAAAVATFMDENAAFLMQKGLYEYSRARAGHYAKVLFGEPEFQAAVEVARWRAYPLGLAMVAEVVEGVLRGRFSRARRRPPGLSDARTRACSIAIRCPTALGTEEWRELRAELARRLQLDWAAPAEARDRYPGAVDTEPIST